MKLNGFLLDLFPDSSGILISEASSIPIYVIILDYTKVKMVNHLLEI